MSPQAVYQLWFLKATIGKGSGLTLVSLRPTFEKVVYAKLLRFREDQLENYQGPPIEYSISDYHHAPRKPVRRSSTRTSIRALSSRPAQSQYSILGRNSQSQQNHSYQKRQPSMAETERSYDPFRSSCNQIGRGQADRARITVFRGPSSSREHRVSKSSLNQRVMGRASAQHHPTMARVQQSDAFSLASSSSETRNTNQVQSSIRKRNHISRCGSRRSLPHNVVVHASTSYRRGISFAQMKRPPNTLHQVQHVPGRDGSPLNLQERYIQDGLHQQASSPGLPSSLAADSPQSLASTVVVRPRKSPKVDEDKPSQRKERSTVDEEVEKTPQPKEGSTVDREEETPQRKERPMSYYWKEDARQVSSELEKVCDEAFNRYSGTSTAITGITDTPERGITSSSATSNEIHADRYANPGRMAAAARSSLQDRPLPLPPAYEHLGTFTYQELAKTRALLQKRAADTRLTGHFDDIIAHLDRLMQPSTARLPEPDRRSISAPGEKPDTSQGHDEFEKLLSQGPFGLRSTSDPVRRSLNDNVSLQRYGLDSRLKGRIAGESLDQKPISPTKPLTIKKKRSDLTKSGLQQQQQQQQQRLRGDQTHLGESSLLQKGDRRSAGLSLLESSLEPIKEDEKETRGSRDLKTYSGEIRKRGWFRRHERAQHSQDSDKGLPRLPPKDSVLSQGQFYPISTKRGKDGSKRISNVPSDESRMSETKKQSSGRGRFFKIFGKRDSKESNNPATARSSGGMLEISLCRLLFINE